MVDPRDMGREEGGWLVYSACGKVKGRRRRRVHLQWHYTFSPPLFGLESNSRGGRTKEGGRGTSLRLPTLSYPPVCLSVQTLVASAHTAFG